MSGANGDTAKPAPRFSDDHYQKRNTYAHRVPVFVPAVARSYVFDGDGYSEFAPYGKVIRDGCVIRIETDGNGQLVEHIESRPATFYGVLHENLRKPERPALPAQDHSRRSATRIARLSTVAAMVATYPDSTARELCDVTGFGHPVMQDYLRTLRDAGAVTATRPPHTEFGRKAPFTYRIKGEE